MDYRQKRQEAYQKLDIEIKNDPRITKLRNEMFDEKNMMAKLETELYNKYKIDFMKARRNSFVMYLGGKEKFSPSDKDIEQHKFSNDERHFMIDPIYKELEELNVSLKMKNSQIMNYANEIKYKHELLSQNDIIDEEYCDGFEY